MAYQVLAHPQGESAMALAAAMQGAGMVLSVQASQRLEDVAALVRDEPARGPLWFQLVTCCPSGRRPWRWWSARAWPATRPWCSRWTPRSTGPATANAAPASRCRPVWRPSTCRRRWCAPGTRSVFGGARAGDEGLVAQAATWDGGDVPWLC